jgi:hypothetical protein
MRTFIPSSPLVLRSNVDLKAPVSGRETLQNIQKPFCIVDGFSSYECVPIFCALDLGHCRSLELMTVTFASHSLILGFRFLELPLELDSASWRGS